MKVTIFSSKSSAMAGISDGGTGTGFLIHRNLLLTTHGNIPSAAAAESSEIRLHNNVSANLVPHRFFITSSILDLTIVGLDSTDGDSNSQVPPHYLKTCSKPNLELGSIVYVLGYTQKKELTVGEGKVVIATDNLIKLSTDGISWSPGSAGFDSQSNLSFMICDPMKLATSPNTKSSSILSSSFTSWKKDLMVQFGIPIPIICDWLNQHWEGSLDELNKPKLPLIRLMSVGQKSEHSCSSFTLRPVFKSEMDDDGTLSSNTVPKPRDRHGLIYPATVDIVGEQTQKTDPQPTHLQGVPTPEIYKSPELTSVPVGKKVSAQIQLLDINFPPKVTEPALLPQPSKRMPLISDENSVTELLSQSPMSEKDQINETGTYSHHIDAEVESTASVTMAHSEAQFSSSPIEVSGIQNGYTSEQETMYSAETAESRNYPSPRYAKFQERRSKSCMMNYNRWGTVQRNPAARTVFLEKHQNFIHGRKMYSQGATSQRSNLCSPTVSSIMKKRNNLEQPNRPQKSSVHSSPRWLF